MQIEDSNAALDESKKQIDSLYHLADKVATLSTGALALTITFQRDIGSVGGCGIIFLKLSWIGFIVSIIGFFFIYLGKIEGHKRLKKAIVDQQTRFVGAQLPFYFHIGRLFLVCGFLIGLILLAIYGWMAV